MSILQERIKLFLMQCTEDDTAKLSRLIDVYTLNSRYSDGVSIFISRIKLALKHIHTGKGLNAGFVTTVKPLYSEQSRDPKKCSLYRGVHPRGVRYVHVHMCLQYTKNGSVLASKGLLRW